VNGEAKFIHLSGHAGDFAKLILKQSPDPNKKGVF
jgi:hypothetical protein